MTTQNSNCKKNPNVEKTEISNSDKIQNFKL